MRGVYEFPHGSGVWCIHWFDHLHRRHREKVGKHAHAVLLYQKRKSESLLQRKLPELVRGRETKFSDLAAEARKYIERHHRSYGPDLVRLTRLESAFGPRPAESLKPGEIDAWLASLDRAPATLNRYKALISLAYRLAIQHGKLRDNPARLVRRRPENNQKTRWLTREEEPKFFLVIDNLYPRKAEAVRFALHTGLRRSEQAALAWTDINWQGRQVMVRRSKHGGARHVPLNDVAMAVLERLRKSRQRSRYFRESDLIFAKQIPNPWQSWMLTAARQAEMPPFTWHDLRHSFASRLRMSGVPIDRIKDLLGHKSITTTMRYAHISPEYQAEDVQKLVDFGREKTL